MNELRPRKGEGTEPGDNVRVLPTSRSGEALIAALRAKSPAAATLLFDLFGAEVNRLVWRLLGADPEHDDVVQQVFLAIVDSIARLRDPAAVRAWVVSVTVRTVRAELRRRRYRRLVRADSEATESAEAPYRNPSERMISKHVYAALELLDADERIPFMLRVIDDMDLLDIAAACGCSLATVKRRIERARVRFAQLAAIDPLLSSALEEAGVGHG